MNSRRYGNSNSMRKCIWRKQKRHSLQSVVRHMIVDEGYTMNISRLKRVNCHTHTQTLHTKAPAICKSKNNARDKTLYVDLCKHFRKNIWQQAVLCSEDDDAAYLHERRAIENSRVSRWILVWNHCIARLKCENAGKTKFKLMRLRESM